MARTNYFKGKTTQSLLDIDTGEFLSWDAKQVRQAVSKLASTANKRAARLINEGVPSYAIEEYYTNIGRLEGEPKYRKFGTRGKSENQLRQEYMRLKQFLNEESSTIKGAEKLEREAISRLNENGVQMSRDDYRKLLKLYIKSLDKDPQAVSRIIKYAFTRNVDIVIEHDKGMDDIDKISERLYIELDKVYRRGGTQYEGTSNYFEFDEDI